MKWKISRMPESVKLLICKNIGGTKFTVAESNMFVFVDFVQRQLNKMKKFEVDKEYKFPISDKEDYEAITSFARFCVNLHRNALTGVCEYEEFLKNIQIRNVVEDKSEANICSIKKSISNEVFVFTNKITDKEKEQLTVLTMELTGVSFLKDKYIKLKCIDVLKMD